MKLFFFLPWIIMHRNHFLRTTVRLFISNNNLVNDVNKFKSNALLWTLHCESKSISYAEKFTL